MIPWNKLPKDMQHAILWLVAFFTGGSASGCKPPMICDPAPPPSSTPTPGISRTPMICDPPPPPSRTPTPGLSRTPMICDPAPPPSRTPMICDPPPPPYGETRPPVTRRFFRVKNLRTAAAQTATGVTIKGTVTDQQGKPLPGVQVFIQGGVINQSARTDAQGAFVLQLPRAGNYTVTVEGDPGSTVTLALKTGEAATVDWVQDDGTSGERLPLAEIRSVEIVWESGLDFYAQSLWPEGQLQWTASGGTLAETDEVVTWQPPDEPGRYLIQVVADWGSAGLAVDSIVLVVGQDGSVVEG